MGITVEDFCKEFGEVDRSIIERLVGKTDFNNTDVIPLNNFATFKDKNYKKFAAKKEGSSFIKLLKGDEKFEIAKSNGINIHYNDNTGLSNYFGIPNSRIHFEVRA